MIARSPLGVAGRLIAMGVLAGIIGLVALALPPGFIQSTNGGNAQLSDCSVLTIGSGMNVALVDSIDAVAAAANAEVDRDFAARYPGATIVDRRVTGITGSGLPLLDGRTFIVIAVAGNHRPGGRLDGQADTSGCTVVVYDGLTGQWEMAYGRAGHSGERPVQ